MTKNAEKNARRSAESRARRREKYRKKMAGRWMQEDAVRRLMPQYRQEGQK